MEVSAAKNGPVADLLLELRGPDTGDSPTPLEEFARRLLRRVSEEWLQEEDTTQVAAAVRALFELVEATPDGDVAVRVLPADESEHRTYLLTVMPDSAFIVETLREGMHGRSLAIESLLHPVLVLERDAEGRITDVQDRTTEGHRTSAVLVVLEGSMSDEYAEELRKETAENLRLLQTPTSDFRAMVDQVEAIVADLDEA